MSIMDASVPSKLAFNTFHGGFLKWVDCMYKQKYIKGAGAAMCV